MADPITFSDAGKLKNMVSDVLKYIGDEFKDLFEIGLIDYLNDKEQKIALIKTFIFPEKRKFYDVYFPLTLRGSKNVFQSDQILNYLFAETNTAAVIGVAGSGKTVLMKHVFLSYYQTWNKIPIFIELRDLNNTEISIKDFLINTILNNRIKPNEKILHQALKAGKFIFLLDGFDEISLVKKAKTIQEIEQFIDSYSANYFLFSSRPGTNIESFPRLMPFTVQPLSREEIDLFIETQLKNTDDENIIAKLKETIARTENAAYLGYVKNPLLLSMFILTFKNYPELPRSKNKFYWNVFDTLCTKHDSVTKKGAYSHEKKTKLQSEDFEKILQAFSYISIFNNVFNFDKQYLTKTLRTVRDTLQYTFDVEDLIYDLSVAISILTEEGLEYKFPHRTLQDYFTVLFIKQQTDIAKKAIYTEKLNRPSASSFLVNRDFFELIIEMDKISFYEFSAIPLFEEFHRKYLSEDNIENGRILLQETKLTLSITRSDEGQYSFTGGGSRQIVPHIELGNMFGNKIDFLFHDTSEKNTELAEFVESLISTNVVTLKKSVFVLDFSKLPPEIGRIYVQKFLPMEKMNKYFLSMKGLPILLKNELVNEKMKGTGIWDVQG